MIEVLPTETIDLEDGRTIAVDSLPFEIRQGFKFFDRINADLAEANHKRDVLVVAASGWKSKLMGDVVSFINSMDEAQAKAVEEASKESVETSENPEASDD